MEQEDKLDAIFGALEAAFKKVEKTKDDAKRQAMLKDITGQLRDAKAWVKSAIAGLRGSGVWASAPAAAAAALLLPLPGVLLLQPGSRAQPNAHERPRTRLNAPLNQTAS